MTTQPTPDPERPDPGALLAELRRLDETMSPGEWIPTLRESKMWHVTAAHLVCTTPSGQSEKSRARNAANAAGIAALRNALPRIVAALLAARREADELERERDRLRAALEPFAKAAASVNASDGVGQWYAGFWLNYDNPITGGDFRRAALLTARAQRG